MAKTQQTMAHDSKNKNEDNGNNPEQCTVTLTDSGGESVEIVLTCPMSHLLKIIEMVSKISLSCTRIMKKQVNVDDLFGQDIEPLRDK